MSLRFKVDSKQLEKELTAARQTVQTGTLRAATEAARIAQQKMTAYLVASVYGTVEGNVYQRTSEALNALGMTLSPTPNGYLLTLSSNAPYAREIELGSQLDYFEQQQIAGGGPPRITADELGYLLEGMAEETGDPHPEAFFGRTGQNYQDPGPHVTPAAVVGMYEFMRRLRAVWREAGAI